MTNNQSDYWEETPNDPWGCERRCKHCGAGDDEHHSYSCPTNMHPDKRSSEVTPEEKAMLLGKDLPKHGDQRNRRVVRKYTTMDVETPAGSAKIEYCNSETDAAEVYCGHCKEWVDTSSLGILGFIICPKCNNENYR